MLGASASFVPASNILHLTSALSNGWPTPAAFVWKATPTRENSGHHGSTVAERKLRVVAGHVFKFALFMPEPFVLPFPKPSLRPNWHRAFVKPGRANHSPAKLQRS